jgi:hypothetical protein
MSAPMKKNNKRPTSIPANGKSTGVRYGEQKKSMILAWYRARLKVRPRGAMTDTCKHFKISATAISNWLNPVKAGKKVVGNGPAYRAITIALRQAQKDAKVYQKLLKALN